MSTSKVVACHRNRPALENDEILTEAPGGDPSRKPPRKLDEGVNHDEEGKKYSNLKCKFARLRSHSRARLFGELLAHIRLNLVQGSIRRPAQGSGTRVGERLADE